MVEYMDNGAKLGWLIDPEKRSIEIYRPGSEPERIENAGTVAGEGPVEGFVLDLRTVWDPFAD
jgi:Uma2 family endonuclease